MEYALAFFGYLIFTLLVACLFAAVLSSDYGPVLCLIVVAGIMTANYANNTNTPKPAQVEQGVQLPPSPITKPETVCVLKEKV